MKFLWRHFLYNLWEPYYPKSKRWRHCVDFHLYLLERERKLQTRESLDHFTHQHTPHWEYIKDVIPWRTRLHLSRLRGKKWALTPYVKLISLFFGIGPEVAQWIIDEYMITAKAEDLPAPSNNWVCAHCGTANGDTALFCKDCGEYK